MNRFNSFCLGVCILHFVRESYCEDIFCTNVTTTDVNSTDECASPISCLDRNSDCNIMCASEGSCADSEIYVIESNSSIVNITCDAANACSNMKLISQRIGTVQCNNYDNSCNNVNIRLKNKENNEMNNNSISSLSCINNNCANSTFYCDNSYICKWECNGIDGCSLGSYEYFCNDAYECDIAGHPFAWNNSESAIMYCDVSNYSGDCEDPMTVAGWIYGGPVIATTMMTPDDDGGKKDNENDGDTLIIAAIVVGSIFVIIIFVIIFLYCQKRNQYDPRRTKRPSSRRNVKQKSSKQQKETQQRNANVVGPDGPGRAVDGEVERFAM